MQAWSQRRWKPDRGGANVVVVQAELARAAMISALLAACSAAPRSAQPHERAHGVSGRVVDETGAAVAGAEVMVCATDCAQEIEDVLAGELTIEQAVGAASSPRVGYASSRPDGLFTVAVAASPDLDAVVAAPGHETVPWRPAFGSSIMLRRTFDVEIEPWCRDRLCPHGAFVLYAGRRLPTRVALPAGEQELDIRSDWYEPGEMQAHTKITVSPTPNQRVRVVLAPTGTGQTITGMLRDRTSSGDVVDVEVEVVCAGGWSRRGRLDHRDGFEVDDVPPPPCVVTALIEDQPDYPVRHPQFPRPRLKWGPSVEVERLPAKGIVLERTCVSSLAGGVKGCD